MVGCGVMTSMGMPPCAPWSRCPPAQPTPLHGPTRFPLGRSPPPPLITPSGDARSPLPSSPLLLPSQLPFALIPVLTFTSLPSVMNDFANGL